jgi:IS5 family transposase
LREEESARAERGERRVREKATARGREMCGRRPARKELLYVFVILYRKAMIRRLSDFLGLSRKRVLSSWASFAKEGPKRYYPQD